MVIVLADPIKKVSCTCKICFTPSLGVQVITCMHIDVDDIMIVRICCKHISASENQDVSSCLSYMIGQLP